MTTAETRAEMHWEWQYLELMRRIWNEGDERTDRTGIGTRSVFGPQLRFDLSEGRVPLLTTKRVFWKAAARETPDEGCFQPRFTDPARCRGIACSVSALGRWSDQSERRESHHAAWRRLLLADDWQSRRVACVRKAAGA